MSDTAEQERPLKRKLAPPRSTWTAQTPLERVCREELPRRSEDRLGLEVEVVSVALDYLAREKLVGHLSDNDLMFVFTAMNGPVGLVSADPMLLAALIEVQMLGRVLGSTREDRVPTTTDGIIARPTLADWVSAVQDHLPMPGRAAMGPRIPDVRAARLTLDDGHFRTLTVSLAMGGGARQGRLVVACPEIIVTSNQTGPSQHETLRRHLEAVTTPLQAILARLPQGIDEVGALEVGQVLPLPEDALNTLRLITDTGEIIAFGKLGKLERRRAVRIKPPRKAQPPPEPADIEDDDDGGLD